MATAFPPDVIVLDDEKLLHARLARGGKRPRIVQAKSYRLAANTFSTAVVSPQLTNESSLADAVRRLRVETGRWDRASLLLPDSWFRINILDITGFHGRSAISELLDLSDRIRGMILDRRPASEIKKAAKEEGMAFLRESALKKVTEGRTTLREINKVTFVE